MKRIAAAATAALISTNSVEGVEESSLSKKQRVSTKRLQIGAPESQMVVAECNGRGEPEPVARRHTKRKSCKPREKIRESGPKPKPQGIPIAAAEAQMAIVVYTGGGEPIAHQRTRKPREKIHNGPIPPPGIPNGFRDVIKNLGGTDCQLILQKGLCKTDMNRNHNRLSMPSKLWIADQALSYELLMMLHFENRNSGKNYVSVPLIDTNLTVWNSVSVRMWNMTKAMVVIAGEWNDLAAANDLKVKDVVQIWCFKFIETGRLGLAMVKIDYDNNSNDMISSSDSQILLGSNVPATGIEPQAHASNSAGSSSYSYSNQSPSIVYFDFLNVESSNGCDNHQEGVQFAGSESSSVMTLNNGGGNRGSLNEAILSTVTDTSSSDIDLTLHL